MEDLKRQEDTRQQRIMKAKEELMVAERELADLPIREPPKDEIVWLLCAMKFILQIICCFKLFDLHFESVKNSHLLLVNLNTCIRYNSF